MQGVTSCISLHISECFPFGGPTRSGRWNTETDLHFSWNHETIQTCSARSCAWEPDLSKINPQKAKVPRMPLAVNLLFLQNNWEACIYIRTDLYIICAEVHFQGVNSLRTESQIWPWNGQSTIVQTSKLIIMMGLAKCLTNFCQGVRKGKNISSGQGERIKSVFMAATQQCHDTKLFFLPENLDGWRTLYEAKWSAARNLERFSCLTACAD